jgi:hypothetical protein
MEEERLKPEEKAEIILWDWLKTKGKKIEEVYFNRINKLNAPVFTTKGINKKPDLLIKINRGYGIEFIAVEVKSSEQSKNIHDAQKILDYKKYIKNKTKYFIENNEIRISHFVIATENSPKGFLFMNETNIIDNTLSNDNWRKTNSKYNLEPKKEYSLTSMFVRNLWGNFRFFRKENEMLNDSPSLGILMSNFAEKDFSPYLMIMNYNNHLKKSKWGARWWKI